MMFQHTVGVGRDCCIWNPGIWKSVFDRNLVLPLPSGETGLLGLGEDRLSSGPPLNTIGPPCSMYLVEASTNT